MARKARFTNALPVYVTPETRKRLDRMSEDYDISLAEVTRYCIEHGITAAEGRWFPKE